MAELSAMSIEELKALTGLPLAAASKLHREIEARHTAAEKAAAEKAAEVAERAAAEKRAADEVTRREEQRRRDAARAVLHARYEKVRNGLETPVFNTLVALGCDLKTAPEVGEKLMAEGLVDFCTITSLPPESLASILQPAIDDVAFKLFWRAGQLVAPGGTHAAAVQLATRVSSHTDVGTHTIYRILTLQLSRDGRAQFHEASRSFSELRKVLDQVAKGRSGFTPLMRRTSGFSSWESSQTKDKRVKQLERFVDEAVDVFGDPPAALLTFLGVDKLPPPPLSAAEEMERAKQAVQVAEANIADKMAALEPLRAEIAEVTHCLRVTHCTHHPVHPLLGTQVSEQWFQSNEWMATVRQAVSKADYIKAGELQKKLEGPATAAVEEARAEAERVRQQVSAAQARINDTERAEEEERRRNVVAEREERQRQGQEARLNPTNELHREMIRVADLIGGLRNVALRDASGNRFTLQPRELVFGQPKEAALGVKYFLNVPEQELQQGILGGLEALQREVEAYGTDVDKECFTYVVDQEAGTSDTKFQEGLMRDRLPDGTLHPDRGVNGRGMRIADFLAHPNARKANLNECEVSE